MKKRFALVGVLLSGGFIGQALAPTACTVDTPEKPMPSALNADLTKNPIRNLSTILRSYRHQHTSTPILAASSQPPPVSSGTLRNFGSIPVPIPLPGPAGFPLISSGPGPSPTWRVAPRNVYTAPADVYINGSAGVDSSTCGAISTPCKTNAGWTNQIGIFGVITMAGSGGRWVTVHYVGAMPTDTLELQAYLDADVCLRFYGTSLVTTLHSGTFTAAVPYGHSNTLASVTDAGVTWSTYLHDRIQFQETPFPPLGMPVAWVDADLGGGVARISQPSIANDVIVSGDIVPGLVDPSAIAYKIQGPLPALKMGHIEVNSLFQNTDVEAFVQWVDLHLVSLPPSYATAMGDAGYSFDNCEIDMAQPGPGFIEISGSWLPSGVQVEAPANVEVFSSLVTNTTGGFGLSSIAGGRLTVDGYLLLDAGTGLCLGYGAVVWIGEFAVINALASQFCDEGGDGIVSGSTDSGYGNVFAQAFLNDVSIVGSGNAGVGWRVGRGGTDRIAPGSSITVTGTGGNFALDADTSDWAFNIATGVYGAATITDTWTHLFTNIAGGGFGGSAHAPRSNTHLIGADVN